MRLSGGSAGEAGGAGEPVRGGAAGRIRGRPGGCKDFFQGSKYEVVDAVRIAEPHLELLRMRVDIDLARIQLQIQHIGTESAVEKHVPIGQSRSPDDELVAYEALVHIREL